MNVVLDDVGGNVAEIVERLEGHDICGSRIMEVELEDERASYTIRLRAPTSATVQEALAEVNALPSVRRVNVSGLQEVE